MNLSNEQAQMLHLLDIAMHPSKISNQKLKEFDVSNWDEILNEMKLHTVDTIISDLIMDLPLSQESQMECMKRTATSVKRFYSILMEQEEIMDLFEEEGISSVVLKGSAAAIYYPRPEYRCMGDIDIIVDKEDYDKAFACLCDNGYIHDKGSGMYKRHESFYSSEGTEVELHRYFSDRFESDKEKILDEYILSAVYKREQKELNDFSFYMLPPLENGLVLLVHIAHHLSTGLGLRQILDWMAYVETHLDDVFWKEQFCEAAEKVGLKALAETTTLLCKEYLGLDKTVTWCNQADKELADDLLEYILDKGNFGRRDSVSNLTVHTMRYFNNPISAMKYLTKGGIVHWKAAQKHKILVPFAWIYQIGHLINMGLNRKENVSTFIEETKQSKRESNLLNNLKDK